MSKHRSLYCLWLSLLFLLCACTANAAVGDGPNGVCTDTLKDVSVHTEQAMYETGSEEITIILYNDGKKTYTFDMEYMLQVLDGDGWKDVNKGDTVVWVQASYTLMPGDTAEQSLALSIYIENIPPGQYRIVKPVYKEDGVSIYYMTAVFTVS